MPLLHTTALTRLRKARPCHDGRGEFKVWRLLVGTLSIAHRLSRIRTRTYTDLCASFILCPLKSLKQAFWLHQVHDAFCLQGWYAETSRARALAP